MPVDLTDDVAHDDRWRQWGERVSAELGLRSVLAYRLTLLDESEAVHLDGLTGDALLAARARMWSRKEAILKATGHGLVVDPSQVVVSSPDAPAALLEWSRRRRAGSRGCLRCAP